MNSIVLEFNVAELIALLGLAQSVYALVYIAFRSGRLSRAILPILFFTILSLAFLFNAAQGHWQEGFPYYEELKWAFWALCIPLSALLILQVARITKMPSFPFWGLLLLVPLAYGTADYLSALYDDKQKWLHINGLIIGAVSLLVIWWRRDWLDNLHARQNGQERFWLIISLIILNIGLLTMSLLFVNQLVTPDDFEIVRAVIGISFVYVASTSLFRIYPQAVSLAPPKGTKKKDYLSDSDIEQALKIENLLNFDKVYQEPSYGRSDMARELEITESALSRIVKLYFDKSVPVLLNGLRVEEAKVLLRQTEADITTIAGEAGFNSIASFNRIFKEITGVTPTRYRSKKES